MRTRARYGPRLARPLLSPVLYAGEALFPRLLLRGIKRRAENGRAADDGQARSARPREATGTRRVRKNGDAVETASAPA